MQIEHDTMVLVADGRKMLFFRNKGDAAYPNLEAETVKEQDNPADRDQATDAPGRSHNSVGSHHLGCCYRHRKSHLRPAWSKYR